MGRGGGIFGDVAGAYLGGFESGRRLADQWEETRQIVQKREERLKAEADYQNTLRTKVEPIRAVRQALWADLSTTQLEFENAMRASVEAGAPLPELARIQADFSAKAQTHLRAAFEASAAEESAWHEYASVDMSPYRAEQAKRELGAILQAEERFTKATSMVAGTFGQLVDASEKERSLGLDERKVAAMELSAQADMVRANKPSGGGGGEAKPMTPKQRADLFGDIDSQLSDQFDGPFAADNYKAAAERLRGEGIDLDAEDPSNHGAIRNATRGLMILERGEDIGDDTLIERGVSLVQGAAKRSEKKERVDPIKQAKSLLGKKKLGDMSDEELKTVEGTVAAGIRKARERAGANRESPFPAGHPKRVEHDEAMEKISKGEALLREIEQTRSKYEKKREDELLGVLE